MKLLSSFTVLSLIGAYYAPRTPTLRELNYLDGFGNDQYTPEVYSEDKAEIMSVKMDRVTSNKMESDSLSRDPNYEEIIKEIEEKSEQAINQAISQLKSILMLDNSTDVSDSLFHKITEFRGKLVTDFEDDLFSTVESFKAGRTTDGPLSDDERYAFIESLKSKWEKTLAKDLEEFQQNVLPRWANSVRNVWKGLEKKVMNKIEQFKKYVHKTSPRSSDTCALPSAVLVGSNAITNAHKSLAAMDLSKRSLVTVVGKFAIFILAVAGVIALALGAPLWFYFLGVFFLIDWIASKIF